jgi:hypothetical protein
MHYSTVLNLTTEALNIPPPVDLSDQLCKFWAFLKLSSI